MTADLFEVEIVVAGLPSQFRMVRSVADAAEIGERERLWAFNPLPFDKRTVRITKTGRVAAA